MFNCSLLALSLMLLVASPAHAATVFITPGLFPPSDGILNCRVVNGDTKKTIEFVMAVFDSDGNEVANTSETTLGPLSSFAISTDSNDARFCIVTLLKGPRTKIRVTITLLDSSSTTLVALEGRP